MTTVLRDTWWLNHKELRMWVQRELGVEVPLREFMIAEGATVAEVPALVGPGLDEAGIVIYPVFGRFALVLLQKLRYLLSN